MNNVTVSVVTTIGTTTVANLRNLPTPWFGKSEFVESNPFGDILRINHDEGSLMKTVAIKINGKITTGKVVDGISEEGQTVTVRGQTCNGMHFEATGVVVEVLE